MYYILTIGYDIDIITPEIAKTHVHILHVKVAYCKSKCALQYCKGKLLHSSHNSKTHFLKNY